MTKNNYPQFISNLPCGEDYTEGKSQERLAVAIAEHIISTDSKDENKLPRIIGLKGEWGTGKSNVIKILDKPNEKLQEAHTVLKQIKEEYHIFEYDAWGHQEDLQRRSFLETLTSKLMKEGFLSESDKVKSWETGKHITWEEKLKELLAHKRVTNNKSIPVFNGGALWAALSLSLTPISAFIAERLESQKVIENIPLLVLIAFCPILLGVIVWLFACIFNKEARHWGYLLKISRDATTSTKNFETINEEEPTVAKFIRWMKDLSDNISEYKKSKLIIVYDNMDRLPADKVKELWSSIHTFFAENGFKNIWVIIPFDEKHLSCAFGENEKKEQLTKHFISKTFPVIYRVTPPVITDYQKLFDNLYSQAFGETEEKSKETIYRILRLEKPNATIREMIEFINSLVALKQIWKEEIDLLYCAIFKLKEHEIVNNPIEEHVFGDQHGETHIETQNITIEEEILSGYYLGDNLKYIIPNNETLQTNIAALVYGVPKKLAEQIPMIKYIDSCFENSPNDINKYSQSSKFIDILQKNIQDTDEAKTDSIIESLSNLDTKSFTGTDKTKIANIWDELVERKEKQKLSKQEFDKSYQTLLLLVNDKENLIVKLCNRLQFFENEGNEKFNGKDYYIALRSIQNFISSHNIAIDITRYLTEIEKDPKIFVEYVQAAKEDYLTFKLSTDNKKLNNHFKENKLEDLSIINYIKNNEKYKFEELKQYIEAFIPSDKLDAANFKPILDAYKLISDKKPLHALLTPNQRNQIWNHFANQVDTNEYMEIVAIQLAQNVNIGKDLTDKQIEYISKQIDYYGNYGDLLVNSNNQNLNKVLKYMTENKLGCVLSLDKVLPKFFNVKNKINVTEETLLIQLAKWSDQKDIITQENIQNIIPKELYQYTKETTNDLTKHINETAIKALTLVDENALYNQINQPNQSNSNNYWYKVVESLIDTDFCKPLPENIFNIGIRYLKEVASHGTIPKEIRAKIIERLDKRRTGAAIEEIRNVFCNSQSTITTQKFQYLENWLRQQGKLKSRASEVVHHIIDPITNDKACLKLISDNAGFYKDLFDVAGDEATPTKQKIEKAINSGNADEKILEFGKLIGITKENKDKQ
ncbi:MAG: hypothetical protein CW341_04080 [Bacteroidetes bacterium]|nr:hypothetical protein [Bacteroidota bacterium]